MDRYRELERENEALRERLSRLGAASLRINQSLDLDAVLQGALDSARSLTGARYGVLTLLDDAGRIQDFLSSAMTEEEARRIWDTPNGMRIFEYLNSLTEPLRIPDLFGRLRCMGLPEFRPPASVGSVLSFLAAPVFHRGERIGNIFVADREEGGEFTPEDESTLLMFASQAALVISNVRRYHEERRARNDLETLMNTSPVGVAVFDAGTGTPVSFNREAIRLVDTLGDPERFPEAITVRRAYGNEVNLGELPLVHVLREAGTVWAEEVVLEGPDGRSVTVLVNGTPIRGEDGEIESFLVTMQDMTPVEELDRLRAEFLAMVSHELRMPLSSIKGSAATVLGGAASLKRAEMVQFFRIIDLQADRIQDLIGSLLDVARIETGTLSVDPKPTSVAILTEEARREFVISGGKNSIDIDLSADLPLVMADQGRIVQVLTNLLSNAARNSSEDSPIRVAAAREGVHIALSVSDEGQSIPPDRLPHLFRKFSRIEGGESDFGAGLRLGICKGIVEAHGGRMSAENSGHNLGTRFTLSLPVAVAGEVVGTVEPTYSAVGLAPGSDHMLRVLAVDDDLQTLRHIRDTLSGAGFRPIVTRDPEQVSQLIVEQRPHLVLLDMPRSGSDGIELMKGVLERAQVPVIFLSEYGADDLLARALDLGAADYVVKPFSPTELTARIRVALRGRTGHVRGAMPERYFKGDLCIDYARRRVSVGGSPVPMTFTEYEVLQRLSDNAGRVVRHDQLLQGVWGIERKGETWLVRNVVKRLRRKLGDDAKYPAYIFTEPRVGYRMPESDSRG